MRKQNKTLLWSIYFDANKSRANGRRVPKKIAIPSPKIEELQIAAKRLGLQPEMIPEVSHPSSPWRKSGLIALPKTEPKSELLKKIAKELSSLRK